MTSIESIKYIIWGNDTPDLTDTQINNLISHFGYNGAIRYIATAQHIQVSREATSIDDGANKLSFNNKLNGLSQIIQMAERYEFIDPENNEVVNSCYEMDINPEKRKNYWGA